MGEEKIDITVEKIKESRLPDVDFSNLNFGKEFSDHMFLAEYYDNKWQTAKLMPYQDLKLSPAACVFHYGQAVFEGMKAYRNKNDEIQLFRPHKNHERLNHSARRMCMQEVPEEIFMGGLRQLLKLDRQWVPKGEAKSLYIRPFLIGDEAFLGVKPSENYKFIIITSPVASYYKDPVKVKIETDFVRAAHGGVGAAKTAGNYAASLYPAQKAKAEGFDQLIWTDAKTHQYIEESGTMNLMLKINGRLITPSLESDSILPGITRDSILQLAEKWGYPIEKRKIAVQEIIDALNTGSLEEAFGMGTAAIIAPIAGINFEGKDYQLPDAKGWEFATRVKETLEGIKTGHVEDSFGWIEQV